MRRVAFLGYELGAEPTRLSQGSSLSQLEKACLEEYHCATFVSREDAVATSVPGIQGTQRFMRSLKRGLEQDWVCYG